MKKVTLLVVLMTMGTLLMAQNLEIEGKAKITVMDTVTDVSANVVRQPDGTLALRQYKIGDIAQGGIIFYIDESGEHGLAADTVDLSTGIGWHPGLAENTQARGDGPFAGEMNTAIIISTQVAFTGVGDLYAARLCAGLQRGGYGDWYLPSFQELNLMWNNLADSDGNGTNSGPTDPGNLGGFAADWYWSSTEINYLLAYVRNFGDGRWMNFGKYENIRVRAVRAF